MGEIAAPKRTPEGVLADLGRAVRARQRAEERQAQLVIEARSLGVSWHDLGRVLGRTGEAVRQRYGTEAREMGR